MPYFIEPFVDYMTARHEIYLRKSRGVAKPWTDDPILQDYRFCNIYRELDTVTVWIDQNIRDPFAQHPYLWFMLCIARMVNWPDTLAELIGTEGWPATSGKWSWETFAEILDSRADKGLKVFTGAYMIRAEPNFPGERKSAYVGRDALAPLLRPHAAEPLIKAQNPKYPWEMRNFWGALIEHRGWGGFMAYEVASDLRWCRLHKKTVQDQKLWANAGPGAVRGLNRLYGRPLKQSLSACISLLEMHELMNLCNNKWPSQWPRLEMREIEHSLCEFDKYERVRLGQGSPRSRYNGRD